MVRSVKSSSPIKVHMGGYAPGNPVGAGGQIMNQNQGSFGGGARRIVPSQVLFSKSLRDGLLEAPIRQTASIFKQPVTLVHSTARQTKQMPPAVLELARQMPGARLDKPKQVFWAKRLEGLRACAAADNLPELSGIPHGFLPIGPDVGETEAEASLAAALQIPNQRLPVTGQTGHKPQLDANPAVFIMPDQPLVQAHLVNEKEIFRQEERVADARRRLEEALKHFG